MDTDFSSLARLLTLDRKMFLSILNSVPAGISVTFDVTCKEIRHNPTAAEFLRIDPRENLSHTSSLNQTVKLFHEGKELSPEEMPIQRAAWNGERINNLEIEFIWEDGARKVSIMNAGPLVDANGTITGAVATFEDVTERKKLEKSLRKSEDLFRSVLENSADCIYRINEQTGLYEYISPSCETISGYTSEEIMMQDHAAVLNWIYADDLPALRAAYVCCREKGRASVEYRLWTKSGELRWVSNRMSLTTDSNGQPLYRTGNICDITERKKAEESFNENQKLYQTLFENTEDAFELLEPMYDEFGKINDLRFLKVNRKLEQHTGLKLDDIVGKTAKQIALDLEYYWFEICDQVVKSNKPIRYENYHESTKRWYDVYYFPYKEGQVGGLFRDVTERKRTEESLRTSEERYYKMFHNSPDMISTISMDDNKFVEVNQKFLDTLGYSSGEVLGHTSKELNLKVDSKQFADKLRNHLSDKQANKYIESKVRTKSGQILTILSSVEIIRIHGKDYRLYISKDITKEKQMEQEMVRLDRLNLVGQMAAGIGHEIRNPMTTVRGFLQLLMEKKEYDCCHEYFDLMISELDRANSIITEFLSLARNRVINFETRNLNAILLSLFPLIQADATLCNININLSTQDIPELVIDEKEIRQLVLNLVRNGLEAMSPGGSMKISTYLGENEIVLAVQDTGQGIEPSVLEKIGTPFFTTKEKGTGLGMAVCYNIAARNNAKIDIKTGTEGTTFFVRFNNPMRE